MNINRAVLLETAAARWRPGIKLDDWAAETHKALPASSRTGTSPIALQDVRAALVEEHARRTEDNGRLAKQNNVVAEGGRRDATPLARGNNTFGPMGLLLKEKAAPTASSLLSPDQARAIELLVAKKPATPAPMFLFTDPNKDPDDLSVLIGLKFMQEKGFLDLKAAVTTLGDRETRTTRAQFAKSVLNELGIEGAKVGVGTDYALDVKTADGAIDDKQSKARKNDHAKFMETPLIDKSATVESDGLALLKRELSKVPDGTAVLLINAGMTDPAALLRDAPELVKQKAARVVIMGGVEPTVDGGGKVVADKRAYNNTTDQAAADFVYQRVQELGIPLTVLSKEATYQAAAPRTFYDGAAATQHPVGVYLKDQQQGALKHLWEGINAGHLPPALTHDWFFKTFTDVDPASADGKAIVDKAKANHTDFDGVWSNVSKFNLYDPLTLLAAVPGAHELLFSPEKPNGTSSAVEVIGKDSIKDAPLARDLLSALNIASLAAG